MRRSSPLPNGSGASAARATGRRRNLRHASDARRYRFANSNPASAGPRRRSRSASPTFSAFQKQTAPGSWRLPRQVYPSEEPSPALPPESAATFFPGGRSNPESRKRSHNLPIQLTSFIGREREIASVTALLGQARLLTLTGSGGCGKTRLALQVGARVVDDLPEMVPDGVWLVDLARLVDPRLVPQAIAASLGIRDEALRPLLDQLVDYCATRRVLLLLDNCEHLIAACAPGFRHLVALRSRPQAAGDEPRAPGCRWRSDLPRAFVAGAGPTASAAPRRCDRIRGHPLVPRTRRQRPAGLRGHGGQPARRRRDLPAARRHTACHRAGCLAHEGFACRRDLRARLGDRFELLSGGSRVALPRHQTLRATIEWSFGLLSEPERTLLRHLAVFAGGWTLPAAEAVLMEMDGPGDGVLELLTHLVDKSLVISDWRGREDRYGMLETVRQFALEQLEQSGEGGEARAGARGLFCAPRRGCRTEADEHRTDGLAGLPGGRARQHPGGVGLAGVTGGRRRRRRARRTGPATGGRVVALLGGARALHGGAAAAGATPEEAPGRHRSCSRGTRAHWAPASAPSIAATLRRPGFTTKKACACTALWETGTG